MITQQREIQNRTPYIPSMAYIAPGVKNVNYRPEDVVNDVCYFFKITNADIRSNSRKREYVLPRQVAMYFIRERFPTYGLKNIATLFDKHHPIVVHSTTLVQKYMSVNRKYREMINEINCIIVSHIINVHDEPNVNKKYS